MKKTILILALLISGAIYAQNSSEKEKVDWKVTGDLIEGVFYFDNGNVRQKGTFNEDGQLHGEWVMYDREGNKTALGNYVKGQKNGKWFFWKENQLTEIQYDKNNIKNVTEWRNPRSIAIMN